MSDPIIIAYTDPWKAGEKFKKDVLRSKKKAKKELIKFVRSARKVIETIELDGKEIPLDEVTEEQALKWWKEWFK